MTPRDQIQEHAKAAAEKVRAAMTQFAEATGMRASVEVGWAVVNRLESATPVNIVTDVRLLLDDEVRV